MRKKALLFSSLLAVLLAAAYLGTGAFLYNQLSDIEGRCDDKLANRPDQFTDVKGSWDDFQLDYADYYMPAYEVVKFASREPEIAISGWYVEADPQAPAVVIVHGLGSCKFDHTVLMPAGMLWRNGFNVLLIDLRDAGESTYEDGRSAIGNEEYQDLLGGWDWLQREKGIPGEKIGAYGVSLGAATALIAFAQEPELPAVFVDSPFDNLPQIIREELDRESYPQFLYLGGIWMARLVAGDNVLGHNPYEALERAGGRPLYFLHGTGDTRIGVHHTEQLRQRAAAVGANARVWIVTGVEHVEAMAAFPKEYERRLVDFFAGALHK